MNAVMIVGFPQSDVPSIREGVDRVVLGFNQSHNFRVLVMEANSWWCGKAESAPFLLVKSVDLTVARDLAVLLGKELNLETEYEGSVVFGETVSPKNERVILKRSVLPLIGGLVDSDYLIAEQDERSLALTEIDLKKVDFMFFDVRTFDNCLAIIKQIKREGRICVDAGFIETLFRDEEALKYLLSTRVTRIYFPGTIFKIRDESGKEVDVILRTKYSRRNGWGLNTDWCSGQSVAYSFFATLPDPNK